MTNQEAIENLKGQLKCLQCETGIDCGKCRPNWSKENDIESLNKAIEVLENQNIGAWKKYGMPRCGEQHYKCTNCEDYVNFGIWGEYYTNNFRYCPHCGAKMKGESQ